MTQFATAACLALLLLLAPAALADGDDPPRIVSASGNAEIRVIPDEVVLTVGVENRDMVLTTAKARNDEIVKAAVAAAVAQGVEKEHIKTDYLSIEPKYYHDHNERRFDGYEVRRSIVITLREVPRFEELLSALLESGVNYVHGVDFRTTELRKYRDQARALAIRAAREKAEALAAELDEDLGQPRSINEGYNRWFSNYGWWGSGRYSSMSQNVIQQSVDGDASLDGPTPPGQITVSASINVTFELAD